MLQQTATKGKAEKAYRKLRELVESGKLDPTRQLTEARAGELAGVSRGPAREALLRLQGQGLLHSKGHSRSRVIRYAEDMDLQDMLDHYEVRQYLEAGIVRAAAENMTRRQVKELQQIAVRWQEAHEAGDRELFYGLHRTFLEHMLRHCGNPLMGRIWRAHDLGPTRPRSATLHERLLASRSDEQWRQWSPLALADAIASHDGDRAERIVRESVAHITEVLRTTDWDDMDGAGAEQALTKKAGIHA